jgi:aspartate/methionine/tyrosine aminotransferase
MQPKDHIIYITPCYTSYLPQIMLSETDLEITSFDLDKDFKIDFKKLQKKFKKNTKAIIINFPHNPTGQILNKYDLLQLTKILKKFKRSYLISDEIYKDNIFNGNAHLSPASIKSISRRVITISGFSKSHSMTGWRIGYCHANKKIISKMVKIQQHILTNVPLFIQKAALKALTSKSNHLKKFNKLINKNHTYAHKILGKNKFFYFKRSYGGFFIFLKIIGKNILSDEFCTKLLKKYNVAVTPGKYFGKNFNKYVRISLSQDHFIFKKAVDLINIFTYQK